MPSPPASPLAPAPPIAVLPISALLLSARLPPLAQDAAADASATGAAVGLVVDDIAGRRRSACRRLEMPPPATAELPLTVQLVSVAVP